MRGGAALSSSLSVRVISMLRAELMLIVAPCVLLDLKPWAETSISYWPRAELEMNHLICRLFAPVVVLRAVTVAPGITAFVVFYGSGDFPPTSARLSGTLV
jgi:hypothetical protein